MPKNAQTVVASWVETHESFEYLQVLLQTLVSPCVGLRFTVVKPEDGLGYANIHKCATLGFPCDYDAVSDAVAAFVAHPDYERILDTCIRQHVYERRTLLTDSGKTTATEEVDEIREYTSTAYETLALLQGKRVAVFDGDEDDDPAVMLRVRLLLYRALSLFLLDQLFWRRMPGVKLPNPRRIKTMAHAYFILDGTLRAAAEGITVDANAPASECLTTDQLYRLKSTEDPFLHDLVNNYDYRTTLLDGDALPVAGQQEISASWMYAEELKELSNAGAFAVSTDEASNINASMLPDSFGTPMSFDAVEVYRCRRVLNRATAAFLPSLVNVPMRHAGDPVAAFFLALKAVQSDIGIRDVAVSPLAISEEHIRRRRSNVGGLALIVDDDPRFPKVRGFADVVERLQRLATTVVFGASTLDDTTAGDGAAEAQEADRVGETTEAELSDFVQRTGFTFEGEPTDCDGTRRVEDLAVLATMLLNRFDVGGLPPLPRDPSGADSASGSDEGDSAPGVRSGRWQGEEQPPPTAADRLKLPPEMSGRLLHAAPLELVSAFVDHLCDDIVGHAIAETAPAADGIDGPWEAIALTLRWAAAVLHFEGDLLNTSKSGGDATIDGSDDTARPRGSNSEDSSRLRAAQVARAGDIARRVLRVAEERLQPRAYDALSAWMARVNVDSADAGLSIPLSVVAVAAIPTLTAPLMDAPSGIASTPSFRAQPPPPSVPAGRLAGAASLLRRALVEGAVHRVRFALEGPVDRAFEGEELLLSWHREWEQVANDAREPSLDGLMSEHSAPFGASIRLSDAHHEHAQQELDNQTRQSAGNTGAGSPPPSAPANAASPRAPGTEPTSPQRHRGQSFASRASSIARVAAVRARDVGRARDVMLRALATPTVDPYHVALRLLETANVAAMQRQTTFRGARTLG